MRVGGEREETTRGKMEKGRGGESETAPGESSDPSSVPDQRGRERKVSRTGDRGRKKRGTKGRRDTAGEPREEGEASKRMGKRPQSSSF